MPVGWCLIRLMLCKMGIGLYVFFERDRTMCVLVEHMPVVGM